MSRVEIGKIDVCIVTKDKETLNLIDMNIDVLPYNNIIISTLPGLSNARNDCMRQVKTDWFAFIDDDIQLNSLWWHKIKTFIENHPHPETLGGVNGFGLTNSKILKFIRFSLLKIRGDKSQRSFTSNTILRREAVEEITLTRKGRLEDKELQDAIHKNGYSWEFVNDAICIHNKSPWLVTKEAFSDFKILVKEKGIIEALKTI